MYVIFELLIKSTYYYWKCFVDLSDKKSLFISAGYTAVEDSMFLYLYRTKYILTLHSGFYAYNDYIITVPLSEMRI